MIKVLLTCASGISSHQFADRMNDAVKKANLDCVVDSCAESRLAKQANAYDVVLIGPEFHYKASAIQDVVAKNAPIIELKIEDYNILNVDKVVAKAIEAYQNFHK